VVFHYWPSSWKEEADSKAQMGNRIGPVLLPFTQKKGETCIDSIEKRGGEYSHRPAGRALVQAKVLLT